MANPKLPIDQPSYQQIIDILPGPFVVIDREYRIVAANAGYRQRYSVSSDDLARRRCYEVAHDSVVPCGHHGEHCPADQVFERGEAVHIVHLHYDRQRRPEQVRIQATPLMDGNGEVAYVGQYLDPIPAMREENTHLMIGRSPALLRLVSLLQRVAPTLTTVMLTGESGVGKGRAAKYLHQFSNRAGAPFVTLDSGMLGDERTESELFGRERGSEAGAARKRGLVEQANGGTLFIDEVSALPLPLQTKLLRVLETGALRRDAEAETEAVDVRLIVATRRDLKDMVARGEFRKDLYFRISAFPIPIPALREHKDDIPALAEHVLARIAGGERHLPLAAEVIEHLLGYDYPGNVRELKNLVERGVVRAGTGTLRPEHLIVEGRAPGTTQAAPAALWESRLITRNRRLNERDVLAALRTCGGHRGSAASSLGVSERTLYRYLKKMRSSGDSVR